MTSIQVIRTDALGTFQDLKVSPDGTRLYGTSGGGLTVINTSTMTATAIPVGPTWNSQLLRNEYVNSVGNVAVSPDGKRAYVTFGATIAERGVGGQSNGSFFTDAQGVSWMVTGGYSGVSVIDTDPTSGNFNKEIARIIVPLGVHDVAASGNSLYVTSGDGKTVTVINTVTNTLAGMFTTDQTASGGRHIPIMLLLRTAGLRRLLRRQSAALPPSPGTSRWVRTARSMSRTTPTVRRTQSRSVRLLSERLRSDSER